ncbi:serine/threonine-protein kinase [Streptomyces sp. NPDC050803]|uniref:serine/threonine-protein kinase n=1 Tax=unclassified Streptomyces TaxID=2593676 RepID=UPI00343F1CAC
MTNQGAYMTGADMTNRQSHADDVLDGFVVERRLGRGVSTVDLVRDVRTEERYAVKHIRTRTAADSALALQEAQRWVGLPEHPYITACHFTRLGSRHLAIFGEYVPGGSLAEWLLGRSRPPDDRAATLSAVLTIAAQTAWALDAAHASGTLHLDVKPSNILRTDDGTAKLTDFGVSSHAWSRAELHDRRLKAWLTEMVGPDTKLEEHTEELAATLEEMRRDLGLGTGPDAPAIGRRSLPYASPEQAEGRALSAATDVWSWAVTLLEMLVGERTWQSGTVAPYVLQATVQAPLRPQSLILPRPLVDVLAACFHPDPEQRPQEMDRLAERLLEIAAEETGTPVSLTAPPRPRQEVSDFRLEDRRMPGGAFWWSGRDLLLNASELTGRPYAQTLPFWPGTEGGMKSRLLQELNAINEAHRMVVEAPAPLTPERAELARQALLSAARVLTRLGDARGAIAKYHECVALLGDEPTLELGDVLSSLANHLYNVGESAESARISEQALAVVRRLPESPESRSLLSVALTSKARSVTDPEERLQLAQESFDTAVAVGDLSGAVMTALNLAYSLKDLDRDEEAQARFRQVEGLLDSKDPVVDLDPARRAEIWFSLAQQRVVDPAPALRRASRAHEILRQLVARGRGDLLGPLAETEFFTGQIHEWLGNKARAADAFTSARRHLESAVRTDGRASLVHDLAQACDHASAVLWDDSPERALEAATAGLARWVQLTELEGLDRWGVELVETYRKTGIAHLKAGRTSTAEEYYAKGLDLTEHPDFPDSPLGRTAEAAMCREIAILRRRAGDRETARQLCARALGLVDVTDNRNHAHIRILTRYLLANLYYDEHRHEESLRMEVDNMVDIEAAVAQGTLLEDQFAEGALRVAVAAGNFGDLSLAVTSGEAAVSIYRRLAEEGRGLHDAAGRTAANLAEDLIQLGRLPEAERLLDEALQHLRTADRGRETPTDLHLASGTPRSAVIEQGARKLERIRVCLSASAGAEVHALLFAIGDSLKETSDVIQARGTDTSAWGHLTECVGILDWVRETHGGFLARLLHSESAFRKGMFAAQADRDAAAEHAYRAAADGFHALLSDHAQDIGDDGPHFAEMWLRTLMFLMETQVKRGDTTTAQHTWAELEASARAVAPEQTEHWSEWAAQRWNQGRAAAWHADPEGPGHHRWDIEDDPTDDVPDSAPDPAP